jgi:hypothetical protein
LSDVGGDAGAAAGIDGGMPAAGPWDAGSPAMPFLPGVNPVLLEPGAKTIFDVSPDEQRVLVSHAAIRDAVGADCMRTSCGDLALVTLGGPTQPLPGPAMWAFSTPDSRSIVFGMGDCTETVYIARADGSGSRLLTSKGSYRLQGPWLYYEDYGDTVVSLYRLRHPDGAAELVVSFPSPQRPPDSYIWFPSFPAWPSPDGETVAWCTPASSPSSPECYLLPAGSSTKVKLPGLPVEWARDGSWLRTYLCTVVDRAGNILQDAQICNFIGASAGRTTFFSRDRALAALPERNGNLVEVHVYTVASGAEVVLPGLPGPLELSFAPDGSRVIAVGREFPDDRSSLWTAPVAGGDWTLVSDDMTYFGFNTSPDSHIVAAASRSLGVVLSIDGRAPFAVSDPAGKVLVVPPMFEPPGGRAKAIFFEGELEVMIELELVLRAADRVVAHRPGATALIPLPDGPLDRGGDVTIGGCW